MNKSVNIIAGVAVAAAIIGGGTAYASKGFSGDHAKKADFAAGYIAKKLDLDATQEQALDVLKDQLLVARDTMHSEMQTSREDARGLVESESFDQAKALELINTKTATVNAVAPELVVALGNFLDTLDGEQKAEILEFMESRGSKGKRGHWRH